MSWEIVIGQEVHAQLSTNTKIFCGASTAIGSASNMLMGSVTRAIQFGRASGLCIAPQL